MDGMIFTAPADPENWRFIVLADTAGWVPVTSHDLDQRTTDAAEETLAAAARLVAGIKAEAQRRIIALTGTTDLTACIVKQSNANMRANELNDIRFTRPLTEAEEAEAGALRALAAAIKAIRAKSNELEAMSPIPGDYTADAYWI